MIILALLTLWMYFVYIIVCKYACVCVCSSLEDLLLYVNVCAQHCMFIAYFVLITMMSAELSFL